MKQSNQKRYLTYLSMSAEQLITVLDTNSARGLTTAQVAQKRTQFGYNQLQGHDISLWYMLWRQLTSPFVLIFIAVAILYGFLGQYIEGGIIGLIVMINTLIGLYQEYHVALNIRFLQQQVVPHCTIVRDGIEQDIPAPQLVPGDIIYLEPGDVIPADCRFITSEGISVDESLLTGESIDVQKVASPIEDAVDIFHAANIGFTGTAMSSGKGMAVIFATGAQTELGTIAFLSLHEMRESSLAQGTYQLAVFTGKLILITVILMALVSIFVHHERSVTEYIIFISALVMSVIPEALPLIVTFCLSQGAARLARKKMLVKRLSAIEDLGSIQILCTDKTGTLSENSMTVIDCYAQTPATAYVYAVLAHSSAYNNVHALTGFEHALWQVLDEQQRLLFSQTSLMKEIPFDPVHRKNVSLVRMKDHLMLIMRGTVEGIIQERLPDEAARTWVSSQERQGHRVLAVYALRIPADTSRSADELLAQVDKTEFVGLISFVDPVKKTAFGAVKKARELGIELKILSGDSAEVCASVAQQLDVIHTPDAVVTGADFEQATSEEQKQMAMQKVVFARVTPEQKYKIIHLLQQQYLVGYLGDGINDAPALKAAHVSMVVQDAAPVAQQAADIIMFKKNLSMIVDGIYEGRTTFVNTLKYITIATVANMGNFYTLAIASLLLDYLPMLPFQILLENLLTDLPMIGLATDTVSTRELRTYKRYNIKEILLLSMIFGSIINVRNIAIYLIFKTDNPSTLQTCWFVTSMLTELLLIFLLRTKRFVLYASMPSLPLLTLTIGMGILSVALPYIPFGQYALSFAPLTGAQMGIILLMIAIYVVATEITKIIYYRSNNSA